MKQIKYSALSDFLKLKVADPGIFSKTVSMALGVALARNAPMPTEAPEFPRRFYSEQVQISVERAAAEFNENIVIDMDLAAQVARSYWLVRCGLCHPAPFIDMPEAQTPGDFVVGLSNAGFTLDANTYTFMNANREMLYVMVNRITAVMNSAE